MALSTLEMQALGASGGGASADEAWSMTRRQGLWAFVLGIYLLFCGAFALWFMAHVWCGSLTLLQHVLWPVKVDPANLDPKHLGDLLTFVNTIGGAMLGAVILCFQNLHKYAVVLGRFRARFSGSYILGPWASAVLGVATYAMLRGGLLVFGTDSGASDGAADGVPAIDNGSCYAFLAIGIMTGFAWERMLARIDDAARQLFGSTRGAASSTT